jgi:redox-sensitive bicupin YhaK (pirin superfamily)
MTPPKYQPVENKNMPKYQLEGNMGYIEVIAGEYNNLKGPAITFTPINMFNARLQSGAKAGFSFSRSFNTGLLVIEGEIKVNNSVKVPENNFLMFGHEGEDFVIEAVKDGIVLIISGEPIDEPIATSGPFVMNTNEEIREAYHDFRAGKFGYLEE